MACRRWDTNGLTYTNHKIEVLTVETEVNEVLFATLLLRKKTAIFSANLVPRQEEQRKGLEVTNDQSNPDRLHATHTRILGFGYIPIADHNNYPLRRTTLK